MKTNIVKIDDAKLREKIYEFECVTNQKAYVFMSGTTIDKLSESYDFTFISNNCKDLLAKFEGRKVYEDNDLKFGEVEIR